MRWGSGIVFTLCTLGGATGCASVFRDSKVPVRVESDPPGASVTSKDGEGVAPFELPIPRDGISEIRVTMTGYDEHHALVRKHVNGWWLMADLATCVVPVLLCVPLLVDASSGAWNDVEPGYRAHLAPLGTGGTARFGADGSYYVLRPSGPPPRPPAPAASPPAAPSASASAKGSEASPMSESERKASARAAYQEGIELQAQKSWPEALARFQFAQRLLDAPTHLLHIAECLVAMGKLVEAQEGYETLTRKDLVTGAPEPFREAVATGKRELDELQPRIPTLRIEVRAPAGLRNLALSVNGRPLPAEVVGIARPMNPGTYQITATAWGLPPAKPVQVTLGERDAKSVDVKLGR